MKKTMQCGVAALLLSAAACSGGGDAQSQAPVTAYENGQIFTGDSFEQKTLYIAEEKFVDRPAPGQIASVVDLAGAYVTPPFADAHNHVTNPSRLASDQFLAQGVFYLLNANTITGPFEDAEDFFAAPDTYDVKVAMGGLTLPGGHPERLYVEILTQFAYPGWTLERFLGDAFHYVGSRQEAGAALDLLEAQGAQIVKTYLLYSEEFAARKDDAAYYGMKGLDPEFFPALAQMIHERGLPVTVHVETDHDVRVAAGAGVAWLAHLPGYGISRDDDDIAYATLSDEAVAALADASTIVTPTYVVGKAGYDRLDPDAPARSFEDAHFTMQKENIAALKAAGVPIAIGTDGADAAAGEADHLVAIGAMSRIEALDALTQTGALIFPDRKLGCFDEGCEASFLVFESNPAAAPLSDASITSFVKQGQTLSFEEAESD
ncbi:MAG: amidohydrolase family protein [Pseudomonadota bacterium]